MEPVIIEFIRPKMSQHQFLTTVASIILFIIKFGAVKNSLIKFDVEPADKTSIYGHSVVLDCTASSDNVSDDKVSVKWFYSKYQFINNDDPERLILKNQSLMINVTEDQIYQCIATIPRFGFITSRKAVVKLATLNEFLAEPEDIDVKVDDKAWFSCHPNTTLPLTKISIQWYKDELPLNLDELRMTMLPTGALEIDQIRATDDGWYWCLVSLDNRAVITSQKGKLTVTMPNVDDVKLSTSSVNFIAIPRTQMVLEGQDVILECAANGVQQSDIKWFRNNELIDMADLDSRLTLYESTTSLLIKDVKESENGTYRCQISDDLFQNADLIVQVPPRILRRPSDHFNVKTRQVELECEIYGNPTPKVYWLHNGQSLDNIPFSKGHNLKLSAITMSDKGFYQCVGSNLVGNVQTSAYLSVNQSGDSSSTDSGSWNVLLPGQPSELRAVSVTPHTVTLAWTMPLASEKSPPVYLYSIRYRRLDSERDQVLNTSKTTMEETVYDLHADKTYEFSVMAWNTLGSSLESVPLRINTDTIPDVPSAPQNFNGVVLNSTSIYVTWQPPQLLSTTINIYRLYYYDLMGVERNVDTQQTEYTLSNLVPFTDYALWVLSVNNNGLGATSKEILLKTFSAEPSDMPRNLTLESLSSTSILIRWEPPPRESRNGIITYYKIRYRKQRRRIDDTIAPGDKHMLLVQDLLPGTVYQFRLSAVNINGTGPYTDWVSIETLHNDLDEKSEPDMPSPLKVRAMSNSITISWSPPRNQTVKIRHYQLGWGKGVPDTYMVDLDEKERMYTIENLDSNSEYVISLRTVNNHGFSPQVYANVYTRDESFVEGGNMLLPPMGLRVQILSASSALVTWTDSTSVKNSRNSDHRYYVVRYAPVGLNVHRFKYFNTSDLSCVIEDLKPITQYEFTVKTIKGRRESIWSMVALNTTWEGVPGSPPRELKVQAISSDARTLHLSWESPKLSNGQITGYNICYMTDESNNCQTDSVNGNKTSAIINNLQVDTMYYFKVQAKTRKGSGPFTNEVSFRTNKDNETLTLLMPYVIITSAIMLILIVFIVGMVLICRRADKATSSGLKSASGSPSDNKKKKSKNQKCEIKPPDLWIHHDQMELKGMEKNSDGGPSMSGSMTLPRSSTPNDLNRSTNSLDKRTYLPGYNFDESNKTGTLSSTSTGTSHPHYHHHHHHHHLPKTSKPFLDTKRQLIDVPPVNINGNDSEIDNSNQHPVYSRNHQYGRVGVNDKDTFAYDPVSTNTHTQGTNYTLTSSNSPINSEQQSLISGGPAVAMNSKKLGSLRSFSGMHPGPNAAPFHVPKSIVGTQVTVRTQTSPYKKSSISSRMVGPSTNNTSSSTTSQALKYLPPHTLDELERLRPSTSTEELNQEMANLEGLMKDLNAITASEFQC